MKFNVYGLADRIKLNFEVKDSLYDIVWIDNIGLIDNSQAKTSFKTKVLVAGLCALKLYDIPSFKGSIYDLPEHVMRLVADILMPTDMLRKYKELTGSYYNLKSKDIAKTFGVSEELVNIKLGFIGVQPI